MFWSRLVAGAVVLFPLSLSKVDFRSVFVHGVSVAAHRSSPAYAAFEDAIEDYRIEPSFPEQAQALKAGEPFDHKSLQAQPRLRQVALRGMTVHQPAGLEPVRSVLFAVRPPPAPVPAASEPDSSYHADPREDRLSIAPPAARAAGQRVIQTAAGGTILIARAEEAPPSRAQDREPEPEPSAVPAVATLVPADQVRPLWLDGQIEMTGGLAFVGSETPIHLTRVHNGVKHESGRIWVNEGRFEIHVNKPAGFLVAELQTRDGRILGRGQLNLYDLHDLPARGNRIGDLRIALRPTTDTAALRAVGDDSRTGVPSPVREARVEIQSYTDPQKAGEDGYVTEPTLAPSSTFVARARAGKHWPSLAIGQAGRPQDIRLFSNSLVQALINISLEGADRAEAERLGVIWGRVAKDGKPLPGARIDLAGDLRPIYFNEAYLPDPSLQATGKNGMFAVLRVVPGVHAVRVTYQNRLYPAQVFAAEGKHVSYLDLEVREHGVSELRVADALHGERAVSARIKLVGMDTELAVQPNGLVEYGVGSDTFMIEAESDPGYEIARTTVSGSPHAIHLPLLRREWLRELASERGITINPGRGLVAGFCEDHDFEVEMTGYAPGERPDLIYFDSSGRVVPGSMGLAGGGFVILNAPPGLQTVFVHSLQSRGSFSQVVVAEPGYAHVMRWASRP